MINGASTAIVLFTKRAKKNKKFPAKLRVTHNRVQRYYSIDTKERIYEFTPEEFKKIRAPKPRGMYKEIQLEFSLIEGKAQSIIKKLTEFSFDTFKTLWGIKGTSNNIITFFNERFKRLDAEEKDSRWNCQSAKKAIQQFFKKKEYIDFREITPGKLKQFENWMLERGKTPSTISVYLTVTKAIFNKAISIQAIPEDIYPFGKKKYVIPRVRNTKRALTTKEIKEIYEYQTTPYSNEDFSRDFWVFTYLSNGINMKDICKLKYENLGTEFFTFVRNKTKEKKQGQSISVPITNEISRIIEKWGNKDTSPKNYIFPFLKEGLSEKEVQHRVRYRVAKVNKGLKIVCKELGIEKKLTTYSARHSFATTLKRSGVSTEFIGESLGHSNLRTTQRYLDGFENEQKKEIAKYLTAF